MKMQSFVRKNIWMMQFLPIIPRISIIHGKGTGVLRQAIQQLLKSHSRVKSYRFGEAWRRRTWSNDSGIKIRLIFLKPFFNIIVK